MEADREFLDMILTHIGKRFRHEVEGFLIGGNAMIYYGLKETTKDLDLVFFHRKDIAGITQIILSHPLYRNAKILRGLSYKMKPELLKKGKPTIIGNSNLPRFDIFYRYVFSVDVEKMFQVAKRSVRFDLLKLKLIEPEHIVFLKAVTDRPVDKEDVARIVKNLEIDWKEVMKIMKYQHKINRKAVWFALGCFYDINKKEELIPKFVINEMEKLFG